MRIVASLYDLGIAFAACDIVDRDHSFCKMCMLKKRNDLFDIHALGWFRLFGRLDGAFDDLSVDGFL